MIFTIRFNIKQYIMQKFEILLSKALLKCQILIIATPYTVDFRSPYTINLLDCNTSSYHYNSWICLSLLRATCLILQNGLQCV